MPRPARRPRGHAARWLPLAVLPLLFATSAAAQQRTAIPEHEPLNPMLAARSGLQLLPMVSARPEVDVGLAVEYGSAVERNINWPDSYLLDAELLRVRLQARRAIGRRGFVQVQGGVTGSYAGFADRFFERYHELIDFTMEERDARPRNEYADRLSIERRGVAVTREPQALALADTRVTLGVQLGGASQTALTLVVPTATGGPFARRTVAVGVLQAVRVPVGERIVLEGTGGVGYTPARGELRELQRTLLYTTGASAQLRVHGAHALYGSLFHHRAPYRGTGFPELDRAELSADFGYLWYAPSGRVWRVGLTEDIQRRDPGIDLVLKVSVGR